MRHPQPDQAVSSVVGTVLILAITVATFGGVSLFVMSETESSDPSPLVDLHIAQGNGQFVVKHRGGASLPADGVEVRVHDGVTVHKYAGTAFGIGPTWDVGESLRISSVFSGVPTGVEVVSTFGRSTLLASAGGGAIAAGQPPADLTVETLHSVPAVADSPVQFHARITNLGGAAPGSIARFEVHQDGSPVWSSEATMPLLPAGSSRTVSSAPWTPATGTYTVRAVVDAAGTVTESNETNNQWRSGAFSPAAAGTVGVAFVDVDGNALYTPGHDQQVQAMVLTAAQCAASDCAAGDVGYVITGETIRGLHVMPGRIEAARIHVEAPGTVLVEADLVASSSIRIRSTAAGVGLVAEASTSANQAQIHLGAAGPVDVDGASLHVPTALGTIALSSGGDITARGASVAATAIQFSAPADRTIHQDGLSLLDRNGAAGTASNVNSSCVSGVLAQGAWNTPPQVCA